MDKKLELAVRKWALQNAVRYDGKASAGAVIGKLISEDARIKPKLKDIGRDIQKIIIEVNRLGLKKQKDELKKLAPELLARKKEVREKVLPELKNAVRGKVVTRIPPEPSKYMHIGHALSFLINYVYAEKYSGKCVLRFDDTNPEKSAQEFLDAGREDIEWLGIIPDRTVIASNDMPKFYRFAEKLINGGNAYACFCDRETMKKLRFAKKECRCRKNSVKENMIAWEKMLNGKYCEDDVVLRLKGDMKSNNGSMRDPVIFRISHHPHFLHQKGYNAWPMYDFESAVEDSLLKVTHILRSAEFIPRIEVQNYIKKLLKLPVQEFVHYGRFSIIGATTKGREIRQMIEGGELTGWDDPRLMTIRALRRRGVVPEAIKAMVFDLGLKGGESKIDFSLIAAHNRKILDARCKRFFFVSDPVEICIENAPRQEVSINLHPEFPEWGKRTFKTADTFYISKDDFKKLKPKKLYRLMECLNFKKTEKCLVFDSREVEKYKKKGEAIMHWLPKTKDLVKVDVLMPDAKYLSGLGEPSLNKLKVGDVIQFERNFFARLDKKEKDKLIFWFTHK